MKNILSENSLSEKSIFILPLAQETFYILLSCKSYGHTIQENMNWQNFMSLYDVKSAGGLLST